MTDAYRLCKEANFNPYLFEQTGRFFVAGKILKPARYRGNYVPGECAEAFWNRDLAGLGEASRTAFVTLMEDLTGYKGSRPTLSKNSRLDVFLMLFAKAFEGLAVEEKSFGQVLYDFSQLPKQDLKRLAKDLGEALAEDEISDWERWLDEKGREAMLDALYLCYWAYVDDAKKPKWIYLNQVARLMLGIEKPKKRKPAPLVKDFQVQADRSILVGADWGPDKLVPLFRYCKVRRIDRVLEFQLNKKQMTILPSETSAADELQEVLADLAPWPDTVEHFLKGKSKLATGTVRIQGCSAILQPENAEVLEAIRSHPRLKNYLETKPPPGYLLIKSSFRSV